MSIDDRFRDELYAILDRRSCAALPRVFVGGEYVGGAEYVWQLHKSGDIGKGKGLGEGQNTNLVDQSICVAELIIFMAVWLVKGKLGMERRKPLFCK